ncbi:hypothetical protein PFISCL1PPCAC_5566, partial [Pristionchus fissidentatus]
FLVLCMMRISAHPWAAELEIRTNFNVTRNLEAPDREPAPLKYNDKTVIRPPASDQALTIRECVTIDDVDALREATSTILYASSQVPSAGIRSPNLLTPNPSYRVIYRFLDICSDGGHGVMEAVHFEIFMPDRPDLRFIQVDYNCIEPDTCEGDYFEVFEVEKANKSNSLIVGEKYPIEWTVKKQNLVERQSQTVDDYVYTSKKDENIKGVAGVSNRANNFVALRRRRLQKDSGDTNLSIDDIYKAILVDTSSAWIYPVEPPKNRLEYAKLVENVQSVSPYTGTFAERIRVLSSSEKNSIFDSSGKLRNYKMNTTDAELLTNRLFQLGVRFRQLITPPRIENVVVSSSNDHPILQVNSEVLVVREVTLHLTSMDVNLTLTVQKITQQNRGKRKTALIQCVVSSDFLTLIGRSKGGFSTDATLHSDAKSATLDTLEIIEDKLKGGNEEIGLISPPLPPLLGCIYEGSGSRTNKDQCIPLQFSDSRFATIDRISGQKLRLNEQQSIAFNKYHRIRDSGYCILSPPGSGKTTVAAAMAASLAMERKCNVSGRVQVLLAVQNVAVENLAISLKTFDKGDLKSYRILSKEHLDHKNPTPYDIFEHLPNYRMWMKNANDKDLKTIADYFAAEAELKQAKRKESRKNEKDIENAELLFASLIHPAKSVLERYLQPDIVLSTVDMILFKLLNKFTSGVGGRLWNVDRVIIDEASLLTESTLYCLIRCFPKASFVLIGDDKQLPPFMYDEKILGHQLAGRCALSVAMRNNSLCVIQLVQVYRAPQCLVEPYNRLSYEGKLVSRKMSHRRPLLLAGLVKEDRPDLLFIDIGRSQKGGPSLYNTIELDSVKKRDSGRTTIFSLSTPPKAKKSRSSLFSRRERTKSPTSSVIQIGAQWLFLVTRKLSSFSAILLSSLPIIHGILQ